MHKSFWLAVALVALGISASLVPQVTYPTYSSGEPSPSVLVAWPGWGVQQELGRLHGTVGRFEIWVAGQQNRESQLELSASLLDSETGNVLRETTIDVISAHIPVVRSLDFPSYDVPNGQRLLLQMQVAEHEQHPVSYRLAYPKSGYENVQLNGVANAGPGPLALTQQTTSSGFRAAFLGEQSERVRLALAVMCSVVAVLIHPRIARRLRKLAHSYDHRLRMWLRPRIDLRTKPEAGNVTGRLGHLLSVPWYAWIFSITPIIHFMARNQLYFAPKEMVIPLLVALFAATIIVVMLRVFLKDWHRPAAITTVIAMIFFGYGHIQTAIDSRIDERVVFSFVTVLAAVSVYAALISACWTKRSAQVVNVAAASLILFSSASFIFEASKALAQEYSTDPAPVAELTDHLFPEGVPAAKDVRPDIYYIILDEYGRHDLLGGFDNTQFIGELERRGFYVATAATTNYSTTVTSLASSLNLAYMDEFEKNYALTIEDKVSMIKNHALGGTLKDLGYSYVHVNSGHPYTDNSHIADYLVDFTPAGAVTTRTTVSRSAIGSVAAEPVSPLLRGYFVRELVRTTALAIIAESFSPFGGESVYEPYEWWSPYRTLQTFEFLSSPIEADKPKFVFAHIIKPHTPGTFDRHGNIVDRQRHGNDAYIEQLIHLNSLVLTMIDEILRVDSDSIIVISGDHGRIEFWGPGFSREGILAAFYLPNGGASVLYPSVSSVNHFRAILDFYFDANLGLLKDRPMSKG